MNATDLPVQVSPERPWLGLRSYTSAEQAYFYGRDAQIKELYQRVRLNPLTVLYGRSGLGKTSLLQAGLLPRLKVEGRDAVLIRLSIDDDASRLIHQVRDALAARLDVPAVDFSLWESAHHEATRAAVELARPVLIFDQFEEVFTLSQRQTRRDRREELAELMAELSALIENRPPAAVAARLESDRGYLDSLDFNESALRIVLTLREDYLHELERWKKLLPSLMRNRMELLELDGTSALDVVVRPARKHTPPLVDEAVAHDIVCFVARRERGTDLRDIEAVPPLLSLLCAELNEARSRDEEPAITRERVSEQGHDILTRFYERCFEGLPAAARDVVEDLLIDNGGRYRESSTRDTVLGEMQDHGVADAAAVLDTLIERRLLTVELRDAAQRIELTHDLLVPLAFASRTLADRRRDEAEASRRAEEERRARASTLKGYAVTGMALLFVAACAAALYAWGQGRKANEAHAQAQAARTQVEETLTQAARRAFGRYQERIHDVSDTARYAYLAESLSYRETQDARSAALLALQQMDVRAPARQFDVGTSLPSVTITSDSSLLLTYSSTARAIVWDIATGRKIRELEARTFHDVALSPDGKRLAHIDGDGKVHVRDLAAADGEATALGYELPVSLLSFGADGSHLLMASADEARIWNLMESTSTRLKIATKLQVVQFDHDAHYVLAVDSDGIMTVFDATTGKAIHRLDMGGHGSIVSASLGPDGRHVTATTRLPPTSTAPGHFRSSVWRIGSKGPLWEVEVESLRSSGFSPDGTRVALQYLDGSVALYDTAAGSQIGDRSGLSTRRRSEFPPAYPVHPAFSPDGLLIASLVDGKPTLRRSEDGGTVGTFAAGSRSAFFRFLPDGARILGDDVQGNLSLFDIRMRAAQCDAIDFGKPIRHIAELPDGGLLLRSADTIYWRSADGGDTKTWHADASKELVQNPQTKHSKSLGETLARLNRDYGTLVAYGGPSYTRLAIATSTHEVALFDRSSGRPAAPPLTIAGTTVDLRLDRSGTRLLVSSLDLAGERVNLELWHLDTNTWTLGFHFSLDERKSTAPDIDTTAERIALYDEAGNARLLGLGQSVDSIDTTTAVGPVARVVFSRNGALAGVLTRAGELVVIQVRSGRVLFRQDIGNAQAILAFDPAGTSLFVLVPGFTHAFHVATGQALLKGVPRAVPADTMWFSKDGKLIALGDDLGTVSLMSAETGAIVSAGIPLYLAARFMQFVRDGRGLMFASSDGTVRSCTVRTDIAATPAQLIEALRYFGGTEIGEDGRTHETTRNFSALVPRKPGPPSHFEQLLRWLAGTEPRTTQPFSNVPVRRFVGEEIARLRKSGLSDLTYERLLQLYRIDPLHPEILDALGAYTRREALRAHWAKLKARRGAVETGYISSPTPAAAASAPAAPPPATDP
jgi:WD40 repeat protein